MKENEILEQVEKDLLKIKERYKCFLKEADYWSEFQKIHVYRGIIEGLNISLETIARCIAFSEEEQTDTIKI